MQEFRNITEIFLSLPEKIPEFQNLQNLKETLLSSERSFFEAASRVLSLSYDDSKFASDIFAKLRERFRRLLLERDSRRIYDPEQRILTTSGDSELCISLDFELRRFPCFKRVLRGFRIIFGAVYTPAS